MFIIIACGKPLGIAKYPEIVTIHRGGYSVRYIAEKVDEKKSTVYIKIRRFHERRRLEDLKHLVQLGITLAVNDQRTKLVKA
jgi:IS30 family transposase